MTSDNDVAEPIDVVLLEFDDPERLDGSFSGLEIEDLTSDQVGGIIAFAGARSGLLGDEDFADAADINEALELLDAADD